MNLYPGSVRWCWAIVIGALWASSAVAGDARLAPAYQIKSPVKVDGVLDEAVWRENEPIGDFVQVEPRPGEPPSEATKVWVAYTGSTLYVALRCEDREPSRLIATEMLRDSFIQTDDNVELLLDTFHDQRNAYYFATNPLGVMVDGRVAENRMASREWDGIWMVKTRVDGQGWTAEFEIPFKTLGFNGASDSWGFNVSRFIGRRREFSRWASPSLDVRFWQVSRAGAITGLQGMTQGIGLDIKTYGIGGFTRDLEVSSATTGARDAGADIFYRITPNLVSSTTFNTDFAETEADARQVNLTRFSLFFPERRTFFLEDAGIFDFAGGVSYSGTRGGGGGGMRRRSIDFLPFFSRRVGLVENEDGDTIEVPIRVGEKLTGKVGRFDLGLMDVKTGEAEGFAGQNLAVGRVKANFFRQSYFGVIFTHGNPEGSGRNHLEGADLRLSTSNFLNRGKLFTVSMYGLRTGTAGLRGQDHAFGLDVIYPNDFVSADFRISKIGENFNPALGYVQRTGVRITSSRLEFGPRPRRLGIRQISFGVNYKDYFKLREKTSETTQIQITPFQVEMNSGDRFGYTYSPNLERLFEPYEIQDGINIGIGRYWTGLHRFSVFTSGSRPLAARIEAETGTFYSGTRRMAGAELIAKVNRNINASVEMEQNWVRLKEGYFKTRLLASRLDYSFTPLMSFTSIIQYDTDSQNIGWQNRVRWIMKPGNEFYFVFNHSWQENTFDRFENYQTRARIKLNYTFRF